MTDLQDIAYSLRQISGVLWAIWGEILGIWLMIIFAGRKK